MPATDSPATVTPSLSLTRRRVIWAASLTVTAGAAALTAHGLYEVAVASRVAPGMAWLYPVVTDGLALVAYAATRSLTHAGRRYAWIVVCLAAVLSGVAQAAYLAGGVSATPGWLRFGVGAWPAIAAVIAAHLVYLLAPRTVTSAATDKALPVTPAATVMTSAPPPPPPKRPVRKPPASRKLTPDQVGRLKAMRAAGQQPADIAADLGVSERTVWRHCKPTDKPTATAV